MSMLPNNKEEKPVIRVKNLPKAYKHPEVCEPFRKHEPFVAGGYYRLIEETFKQALFYRDMTQVELAAITGISKQTISYLRRQHKLCRMSTVFKIAEALDVAPDYIFEPIAKNLTTSLVKGHPYRHMVGESFAEWRIRIDKYKEEMKKKKEEENNNG